MSSVFAFYFDSRKDPYLYAITSPSNFFKSAKFEDEI